jgi:hypothetical protein
MEMNPYKPKLSQVEIPSSADDTQSLSYENTR